MGGGGVRKLCIKEGKFGNLIPASLEQCGVERTRPLRLRKAQQATAEVLDEYRKQGHLLESMMMPASSKTFGQQRAILGQYLICAYPCYLGSSNHDVFSMFHT